MTVSGESTSQAANVTTLDLRGFIVVHQKLTLHLFPIEQTFQGVAEIQLRCNGKSFHTINLNARHIEIQRVLLDGQVMEYRHISFDVDKVLAEAIPSPQTSTPSSPMEPVHYPNRLRQALFAAKERHELSIMLPGNFEPKTGQELILKIEYRLLSFSMGIRFLSILPSSRTKLTSTMIESSPPSKQNYFQICAIGQDGMGRLWMPCFDNKRDRCMWDLEYYISTEGFEEELSALSMVSSGVLCHQFANRELNQKIFHFKLDIPTAPCQIAFAAGLFDMVKIPSAPFAMAFCPKGMATKLALAMDFFSRAFGFASWFLSTTFPYPSYYLLFLRDFYEETVHAANVSMIGAELLFDPTIIDQQLETRRILANCLLSQYFGVRVTAKTMNDSWLMHGIVGYLTRSLLRIFHGNNDHRLSIKKDIERLVSMEVGRPSVYEAGAMPLERNGDLDWLETKSSIIMQIFEHRLSRSALQKVLAQLCLDQGLGRLEEGLATADFMKLAKRISGKDIRSFADQWIFSAGTPLFSCSFVFNRKRSIIEVDLRQSTPGHPQRKIAGNLLIRVHEVGGVFDHSVHIDDHNHHFELPVHAKARRIKRKKRLLENQSQSQSQPQSHLNSHQQHHSHSQSHSQPTMAALRHQDNANHNNSDGEEDPPHGIAKESTEATTPTEEVESFTLPISWLRLDPEMEWIAGLEMNQPESMLLAQLQDDHDVVAQYEAISQLRRQPSETVASALEKIMGDSKWFYQVRIAAAYGLASCAATPDAHFGALKLISFYNRNFAIQSAETVVIPIPRTNNFEGLQEYFIQKALAGAMAVTKTSNSTVMELIGQVLLNMLRFNDNAGNSCSDNYYLAAVIDAVLQHLINRRELGLNQERIIRDLVRELERYANLERMLPTYHNTVMVGILHAWQQLRLWEVPIGQLDAQIEMALQPGNYYAVRLAAALLVLRTSSSLGETGEGTDLFGRTLGRLLSNAERPSIRRAFGLRLSDLSAKSIGPRVDLNGSLLRGRMVQLLEECLATSSIELTFALIAFCSRIYEAAPNDSVAMGVELSEGLGGNAVGVGVTGETITGQQGRISLRITLPLVHELSSEGEQQLASKETVAIEEPDWYLEVAGEEAAAGRSQQSRPLPKLRLALPSTTSSTSAIAIDQTTKSDETMESAEDSLKTALQRSLQGICSNYDSFPFRQPVDPSVAGYYQVIPHPMDLSTIQRRLDGGDYQTLMQFCKDLRLIFDNCFFFNQPESLISEQAKRLRLHAFREVKRLFPDQARQVRQLLMGKETAATMPSDPSERAKESGEEEEEEEEEQGTLETLKERHGRRGGILPMKKKKKTPSNKGVSEAFFRDCMQKVMARLKGYPYAFWFMQPVDPVALNIPSYFEIVKEPMDLSTLQARLDQGEFDGCPQEFIRLADLIFTNCIAFNPQNTIVHQNGLRMREFFHKQIRKFLPKVRRTSNRPSRQETNDASPSPKQQQYSHHPHEQTITTNSSSKVVLKLTLPSRKEEAAGEPIAPSPNNGSNSAGGLKVKLNLGATWQCKARQLVDRVCQHEAAEPFLSLLDSTIRRNLDSGQYTRPSQLRDDLRHLFDADTRSNLLAEAAQTLHSYVDLLYKQLSLSMCDKDD